MSIEKEILKRCLTILNDVDSKVDKLCELHTDMNIDLVGEDLYNKIDIIITELTDSYMGERAAIIDIIANFDTADEELHRYLQQKKE